jgi:hypothetical protein
MIVIFDFDITLKFPPPLLGYNTEMVKTFKQHMNSGDEIHIVTSRNYSKESRQEIEAFLDAHELEAKSINFTDGDLKVDTILYLNGEKLYDDDSEELHFAKSSGIEVVNAYNGEAKRAVKAWMDDM